MSIEVFDKSLQTTEKCKMPQSVIKINHLLFPHSKVNFQAIMNRNVALFTFVSLN